MPYDAETLNHYLTALGEKPLPSRPKNTRVPLWLHEATVRGLRHEPQERYASMDELLAVLAKDPTERRRNMFTAAALAGIVAAGGAAGWARHARNERAIAATCAAGDSLVRSSWNETKRESVGVALRKTGVPGNDEIAVRTQRNLDAYANMPAATYRTASEATLVQTTETAATLAARLVCLDEQRAELETVTDVMEHLPDASSALAKSVGSPTRSPRRVDVSTRMRYERKRGAPVVSRGTGADARVAKGAREDRGPRALREVRRCAHPRPTRAR